MSLFSLLRWDLKMQKKAGFFFIYIVLTLFYAGLLAAFPASWRKNAAAVMIFTDPAAMGLFFMGAIVLLEKSQRVLCALTVSPLTPTRYILSKCLSLSLISTGVALLLALYARYSIAELLRVLIAVFLSSVAFSLMGLVISAGAVSMNQFLLRSIPFELLCFIPAILYLFGVGPSLLRFYPPNACIGLLAGIGGAPLVDGLVIAVFLSLLFIIARREVKKMWNSVGGAKL